MGNDGGSIPKRRELVKEAAQRPNSAQLKETQQEQQEYQWTTCLLSHKPLKLPVVSDSSGRLYNKDAILEFLLPDDSGNQGLSKADSMKVLQGRVNNLRDVVEVKFNIEEEPETKTKTSSSGTASPKESKWCNELYTLENVITILPISSFDKERLLVRALKLKDQGLTHSLKKLPGSGKKRKKNGESTLIKGEPTSVDDVITSERKGALKSSTAIKNAATASLTAKVLAEEQERSKRRKMEPNKNLKSLFSSGGGKHKDGDFMTRGFSIPAGAKH
ncbi:hypothetical protein MMC14_001074 [Varicellaria rhodocarpa]|nr:hypothetical protein [Varicellaria rhodocarpa]